MNRVDGLGITAPMSSKGLVFFTVDEPVPASTAFSNRVTLYAMTAFDGQLKWKFGAEKGYGIPKPLAAAHTICFGTDEAVFALEPETGRQLWSFSADQLSTDLLADDQHLYVMTSKGSLLRSQDTLRALTLTTGLEKWSRGVKTRRAMVHGGVVYAGLQAIDAATGKELWSRKGTGRESVRLISEGKTFLTSPTVRYVGTPRVDQGYLYAIDAETGQLTR